MAITFPLGGILNEEKEKGKIANFEYGLSLTKILVTGAKGQLGSELRKIAKSCNDILFDFTDIDELDLCNSESVMDYVISSGPKYIVNCAAWTAVDKAEDEPAKCFQVNRDAVENLANAALKVNAKIIHISTDYVFDGKADKPYTEDDEVCPDSVYGNSKLEGERILQSICKDYVIIRTAWLYSSYGANFVKTILRKSQEVPRLNIVNDQFGSPTYARDLAGVIMTIINSAEKGNFVPGIFNYSNEGIISWYDLAVETIKLGGIKRCEVLPIPSSAYPAKAKRPSWSVLDKTKIINTYGINVPQWGKSLAECISLLND
jgi:dTDP-4-dehydrorhamnose reductase